MTFEPILPWWVLGLLALLTLVLRMYTLYRVLVVVGKGSQRKVVVRWSLLTLVIVCLLAASVRPGIEQERHTATRTAAEVAATDDVNVFFVVDRSLNSRADDYGDNQFRMAGIRADMQSIVDQYPTGRFSVTSFATRARIDWPLSDDHWSLRAAARLLDLRVGLRVALRRRRRCGRRPVDTSARTRGQAVSGIAERGVLSW